jgi:hypothetical protein
MDIKFRVVQNLTPYKLHKLGRVELVHFLHKINIDF